MKNLNNLTKKIRNFFNKYKEPTLILFTLIILVIWFSYIWFTQENFNIFIYSWFIIYLPYMLFFELEKLENFILNKITYILIIGLCFIISYQTDLKIETKDLILMVWWIIAFWYWYKKYERDKELEIIEKYTEKYNNINLKINKLYNQDILNSKEISFETWNLLNLFFEEFYLKEKWFISESLWQNWKNFISNDIDNIFEKEWENMMIFFKSNFDLIKNNSNIGDKFYLFFIKICEEQLLKREKSLLKINNITNLTEDINNIKNRLILLINVYKKSIKKLKSYRNTILNILN